MLRLFAENDDFFLSLQHGYFRCFHDTAAYVLQTELVIFIRFLGPDNLADQLLQLRNEPDQDSGVDDIEAGMEGRQCKG